MGIFTVARCLPLPSTVAPSNSPNEALEKETDSADELASLIPIDIVTTPFNQEISCENRFVPRELDHITTISGDVVHLFDSNGAGLAINDLDNDNNLDICPGQFGRQECYFLE